MDNFIFSLNIVFPLFLLIVLGYFLKRKGLLTPEFRKKATTLIFYYSLPCSLFRSVAGSDILSGFDFAFVVYILATSLVLFFVSWGVTVLLVKDRSQISAIVHCSFRGNFAYIGLAVLQNLLNTTALTGAVLVITFVVPIYNILAIIVLSHYNTGAEKPSVKSQLLSIIKNPLIIGIVLGLPFSLFRITIPVMFDKALSYLAQIATPLALLMIGATLAPETFMKKPKGIVLGTLLKNILGPGVFTLLAIPFGFRGEALATIFTMFAVPSAVNCYIMTDKMGGDGELAAGIVMATSLFSVITMTLGIFLLKTFALV